jgi:hypothetical protein
MGFDTLTVTSLTTEPENPTELLLESGVQVEQ